MSPERPPGPAGDPSDDDASTITDRYGYLFRSDHAEGPPDPGREDEDATPVRGPAPYAATGAPAPPPPAAPAALPNRDDESRHNRRVGLIIGLAVLLVVLLGSGALALSRLGDDRAGGDPRSTPTVPRTSTPPSASTGASPLQSPNAGGDGSPDYAGPVVAVRATGVTADCQAPDARDDAGQKVSYAPQLTEDGDNATAWRCDGDGVGKQLTLTLPADTQVAELGLVNGYAKVDPKSGKDRYPEYRRITKVTWILDGDNIVSQSLLDGAEDPQTIRIPATPTQQVGLRIETSTEPGSPAATRDAVLISEISIGRPQ